MSSLWEERAARNEALFREVNEQIRERVDSAPADPRTIEIVCECSNDTCMERIRVSLAIYERVRAEPRQFLVTPGHRSEIDRVVEEGDGYVIVEKGGVAGRIASRTDPRG